PDADLNVGLYADTLSPRTGTNVNLTVTVMNSGAAPVTGVEILSPLPPGLEFVSASPSIGTYDSSTGLWMVPSVSRGELLQITARMRVVGAVTVSVEVTAADQVDPDST